ncbi:LamG domain-containing protein, partial [Streptomyces sp. MCAF7]
MGITSDRYPDDTQWYDGVGEYGTFTLDAASPDAVGYQYELTGEGRETVTPSVPGGPVTFRFMPERAGVYHLSVRAYDSEGSIVGMGASWFRV